MLKLASLARRLRDSRTAAAAVIVAVALPVLIGAAGLGTEVALVEVRLTELQGAADAAAGAGRQRLDAFTSGFQSAAVVDAQLLANGNVASSLQPEDVEQGWWDIKTKKFGEPIPGQTGAPFSNAVRVTTRLDYRPVFARLFGVESIPLKRSAIGYKCSNTDYPLTLIPDDPRPPSKPAIYLSFAADGNGPNQSYYFEENGRKHPVFKFYSPTDDEDVSFVLYIDGRPFLQVDTYCKGTFLVSPGDYNWASRLANPGEPAITARIYRGSTNNSFALLPVDAEKYPLEFTETTYNFSGAKLISYLRPERVHVTTYPSDNGNHDWASEGNPTPDRRTILVR